MSNRRARAGTTPAMPAKKVHAILAERDGVVSAMAYADDRADAERIVFALYLLEQIETHSIAMQNAINYWHFGNIGPHGPSVAQCNELLDDLHTAAALTRPSLEKLTDA